MKRVRPFAWGLLIAIFAISLGANWLAPAPYARQFRDSPMASPSARFPLGTDDLGRDQLSRLLYGSRVSLLLAPAAALIATLLAALIGGIGGYAGGWPQRIALGAADLFLSLPWLFLLLTVRAMLPLNVPPLWSVAITFLLLGSLGWAASARIVCAGARMLRHADFVLQARACGTGGARLLFVHVLPNLKAVLFAQFGIAIPVFILSEANLSFLGLGVAEPLPSWGNLLTQLEKGPSVFANPWRLAPVLLLLVVVSCFHLVLSEKDTSQ
ncbi:MAG: ABC transporter permease subunit [Acidobacteriota bacterium]|nr:ABC transporter permease subunit [Acidobacteriota bacterium]